MVAQAERCSKCKHTLEGHENMGWTCDCNECPWKRKVTSKIVTVAARNIKPGDTFVMGSGDERPVLNVERVDWPDRIQVALTVQDNKTIGKVSSRMTFRLTDRLQVRRNPNPSEFSIDWTPRDADGKPVR
jgi:hypothetical protein